MSQPAAFVILAGRIATCDERRATPDNCLGIVSDGGIVVEQGRIAFVGTRDDTLARAPGVPILVDAVDAVITPGLADAHTHAAWIGSRHDEYVRRMQGDSYEEIAAGGGGIVASMRAVRAASRDALAEALANRLSRMAALGVTTVEIKSGYGLDEPGERKQLEAIAEVAARPALPRVVATYLALHAIPPGAASRDSYVRDAARLVGAFAREGLARFVDAYVDRSAFTPDEAEIVARSATMAGLGVRFHVGQFADVGGAALAARIGAASADHLEHVSDEDLEGLARAGTRAVLLPLASFTLGDAPPSVAALRRAGVRLVVASDANPGTAPTESLPLALALAVRTYGLHPDEAILGATREAAASLGLASQTGCLAPGLEADIVVWDLPHEHAITLPWGCARTRLVLRSGVVIAGGSASLETP